MTPTFLDYETRSWHDLPTHGAHVVMPHTEILMAGVAVGDEEPHIVPRLGDLSGPFVSWGRYDYYVYKHHENPAAKSEEWIDAMALALYIGFPHSLDAFASAIGLKVGKSAQGTRLINKFSKPREDGTFLELDDYPEEKALFEEYCLQDVRLLQKAWGALGPIYDEWQIYMRDNYELIERVNDRGVPIDRVAAERILYQMEEQKAALREECIRLTGFEPTQTEKLRAFLGTPDMTAATLQSAVFHDPIADRVRDIRLAVSKAAAGKIKPMLDLSVDDARARGCLVSNGAHTGRGSSRKIQLHNLKRSKTDEEMFRRLHRGEVLDMPILHAQENIRGFLRAEPGNRFVVADYSQIECRLLAWIADEQDLMAAFSSGHDVYRLMAANIYQVPVEEVTDEQRLLGKVGTLGSGYGVSGPGLARQAPGFGLTIDDELGWHAVHSFRNTFPGVVKLWHQLDKGIIGVVLGKRERFRAAYCEFTYKNSCLVVTLPSGRALRYFKPEVRDGKHGPVLYFQGRYGFSLVEKRIWGGHWVENLCQAIATDIKLDAMKKLDAAGEQIVLEVHDEIIIEAAEEEAEDTLKRTLYTMTHDLPEWFTARKLIKAEGFTCERYTK